MAANCRARVRVELEIDLPGGGWGGDCSVQQVYDQAHREVVGHLRAGLAIDGLKNQTGGAAAARIIGEPKVTAIMVTERD